MVDWKDVATRSVKTFVEAVVAFFLTELAGVDIFANGKDMWVSIVVAAVAAGVAAVYNGVIRPMLKTPE
jgi:hypothetical protein